MRLILRFLKPHPRISERLGHGADPSGGARRHHGHRPLHHARRLPALPQTAEAAGQDERRAPRKHNGRRAAAEQREHTQLLAKGGAYAALYNSQFA